MNTFLKLLLVIKTLKNFPIAIIDRMGYIKGEIVYELRKGDVKFIARAGTEDLAEVAVVASGSEYKIQELNLPSNPIVIDCGGHIGSFSVPLYKYYKDKCRIYTYEPDKDNFRLLKRNIELNKAFGIKCFNLAISDYVGKGSLITKNLNTDAYYLSAKKGSNTNCNVSTLYKEVLKNKLNRIDLLKLDIEGGEERIFKHNKSLDLIRERVRYIFIEIGDDYDKSDMKKIIELNFKLIDRNKNVLTLENFKWEKRK